jgi:hypothetical protein
MSENRSAFLGWFTEMNARAEGYAQTRLSLEVRSLGHFRERKILKFAFAFNFLKLYYEFSAPVVTIVARSHPLMSLARMLYAPTRQVARKILG